MKDFLIHSIKTRRSIRKFNGEKVSEDDIQKILECAMFAPSAGNQRPWEFLVLTERDSLNKIPIVNPNASMAKDASAAILVCGNTALEKFKGFWVQDCSAAIENILLATHSLGLGAVWTAAYPREERVEGYRKLFALPENIIPLALIPIGHYTEKPADVQRFEKEKVHYERW